MDGPYGESHQNWDRYNISIMVAGGIGVTPFASILKDIVHKVNQKLNVGCKKVKFIIDYHSFNLMVINKKLFYRFILFG